MSYIRMLTASTSVLCLTATAGFADLTALQVWEDWQSYLQSNGYAVQGEAAQGGDTLTIRDLAMRMDVPEDGGRIELRMGQVQLVEQGDGSVVVILPATMPVAMDLRDEAGEQVALTTQIAQQGLEMRVTGDPDAMQYVYSAQEVAMMVTDLVAGEAAVEIGAAEVRMTDLAGRYESEGVAGTRAITHGMTAGPVSYQFEFTDPKEGGHAEIKGTMARVSLTGDGEHVGGVNASDMAAALRAGLRIDSEIEYEDGTTSYKVTNQSDMIEGTQSSEAGTLRFGMGPDGLRYAGEGRGVRLAMSGNDLPFPVTAEMARLGFALVMPVAKSDAAQYFALALDFGGFTMSDMIWAMFDPGAQLPRDPATIRVDLSGKGRLFYDLLDPKQMSALEDADEVPGEIESLALNDLTIDLAGAKLTGAGAFTFDQTDLTSFDGVPAPEGAIDLRLVGGNGLLDKLIDLGFVAEDQAMVVRMMAGMFARADTGEDELTSRIEVTEEGQVLANGQRLK
ncbi:DUF2125 domain-containing protein [Roseovarius sp.]|uniref:DUF2125 domain-containing protein n=1 Tax=Roseovarius sp. TaxID=1486281 RepID=UPI003A98183A